MLVDLNNNTYSSSQLREQGNNIYKSINESLCPSIKETRLKNALNLYQAAINSANNNEDLSSAYKNHSTVSFGLFKFFAGKNNYKLAETVYYYIQEMLLSSNLAIKYGRSCKPYEWVQNLEEKCYDAIKSFCNDFLVNLEDIDCQVNYLIRLNSKTSDIFKYAIISSIAKIYYNGSLRLQDIDLNQSFRAINECNFYYEECQKLIKLATNTANYEFDLDEFNNNLVIQKCIVEGLKYKRLADLLLDTTINEEEILNMDTIWDCIDMYHESIIKTKDKDLEIEAEILSKLGMIYGKVLKMSDKSKTYYYGCFNLCESMKPKLFTTKSWFIRCSKAIKEFQNEVIMQENKKEDEERKKVESLIAADLAKIKKIADKRNGTEFLNFVYKNYPPKSTNYQAPKLKLDSNIDEKKKAFKKGLIDYHPDKNSASANGYAWYFTCMDISKHLGSFYECLK